MATKEDDKTVFLDTNVLVYATVPEAPRHEEASQAVERLASAGVQSWISRHVVREYLATLTRPQLFGSPPPIAVVVAAVHTFESQFNVAEDGPLVTLRLLELIQQVAVGGKQVHDANIVATMLTNGITHLLTANAADFARFAGVITVVPLEAAATLLSKREEPQGGPADL